MDSSGITRPKDQQDDGTEDDEEVVADLVVGWLPGGRLVQVDDEGALSLGGSERGRRTGHPPLS